MVHCGICGWFIMGFCVTGRMEGPSIHHQTAYMTFGLDLMQVICGNSSHKWAKQDHDLWQIKVGGHPRYNLILPIFDRIRRHMSIIWHLQSPSQPFVQQLIQVTVEKKTQQRSALLALARGIHRSPVDCLHKRTISVYHGVCMSYCTITGEKRWLLSGGVYIDTYRRIHMWTPRTVSTSEFLCSSKHVYHVYWDWNIMSIALWHWRHMSIIWHLQSPSQPFVQQLIQVTVEKKPSKDLIKAPCVARASVSSNGILTMWDMPPWWAAIHSSKHHEDDLNDRFCVFCALPNNMPVQWRMLLWSLYVFHSHLKSALVCMVSSASPDLNLTLLAAFLWVFLSLGNKT